MIKKGHLFKTEDSQKTSLDHWIIAIEDKTAAENAVKSTAIGESVVHISELDERTMSAWKEALKSFDKQELKANSMVKVNIWIAGFPIS